jgi:hypothetical protein
MTWIDTIKTELTNYVRDNLITSAFAGFTIIGSLSFGAIAYKKEWDPVKAFRVATKCPLPSNPHCYFEREQLECEIIRMWGREKSYSHFWRFISW